MAAREAVMVSRIGIISDTHGVLHPLLTDVFASVDHIVHAGDIGGAHVLEELGTLAPVTSVEGNVDDGAGEGVVRVEISGLRILLTHVLPRPHQPAMRIIRSLERDPADVVVFGHSHLPHDEMLSKVRYFNPASAGPRRFDYPTSVGIAEKKGRVWRFVHVPLDERSGPALEKWMNSLSE